MSETIETKQFLVSSEFTAESVIEWNGKAFTFGTDAFSTIQSAVDACDGTTDTDVILKSDFTENVVMKDHVHIRSYLEFMDAVEGEETPAKPKLTGSINLGSVSNASVNYIEIESTTHCIYNTATARVENITVEGCTITSTGVRPSAGHGCVFHNVSNLKIRFCVFTVVDVAPDGVENANAIVLYEMRNSEIAFNKTIKACDGVYIPSVSDDLSDNTFNCHDNTFVGVLFGVAIHFAKYAATFLIRNNKITASRWALDTYQFTPGLKHVFSLEGNDLTETPQCVYCESTLNESLSLFLGDEMFGYLNSTGDAKFYNTAEVRDSKISGEPVVLLHTIGEGKCKANIVGVASSKHTTLTTDIGEVQFWDVFNLGKTLSEASEMLETSGILHILEDAEISSTSSAINSLVIHEGCTATLQSPEGSPVAINNLTIDGDLKVDTAQDHILQGTTIIGKGNVLMTADQESTFGLLLQNVNLNGFTGSVNSTNCKVVYKSTVLPAKLKQTGDAQIIDCAATFGKCGIDLTDGALTVAEDSKSIFQIDTLTGETKLVIGPERQTTASRLEYTIDDQLITGDSSKARIAVGPCFGTLSINGSVYSTVDIPFDRFYGAGYGSTISGAITAFAEPGASGDTFVVSGIENTLNGKVEGTINIEDGRIVKVWGVLNSVGTPDVHLKFQSGKATRLIGSNYDGSIALNPAGGVDTVTIDMFGGEVGQIRGMSSTAQKATDPAEMKLEMQNFKANSVIINVRGGKVTEKIYGGSLAGISNISICVFDGAEVAQIVGGSKFVQYGNVGIRVDAGATVGEIYGGSAGGDDLRGYAYGTRANIQIFGTVTGDVIGGGYGGDILLDTKVILEAGASIGGTLYLGLKGVGARDVGSGSVKNAELIINGNVTIGNEIISDAVNLTKFTVAPGIAINVPVTVDHQLVVETATFEKKVTVGSLVVIGKMIVKCTSAEFANAIVESVGSITGPIEVQLTDEPADIIDLTEAIVTTTSFNALDLKITLPNGSSAEKSKKVGISKEGEAKTVLAGTEIIQVAANEEDALKLAEEIGGTVVVEIPSSGTPVSTKLEITSFDEYRTPHQKPALVTRDNVLMVMEDGMISMLPVSKYSYQYSKDVPFSLTHVFELQNSDIDFNKPGLRVYFYRFVYREEGKVLRLENLLQHYDVQQGEQMDKAPRLQKLNDAKKVTLKIREADTVFASMRLSAAAMIITDVTPDDAMIATLESKAVEAIKKYLDGNSKYAEVKPFTPKDIETKVKEELTAYGKRYLLTKEVNDMDVVEQCELVDKLQQVDTIAEPYAALPEFQARWVTADEPEKIRIAFNIYQ